MWRRRRCHNQRDVFRQQELLRNAGLPLVLESIVDVKRSIWALTRRNELSSRLPSPAMQKWNEINWWRLIQDNCMRCASADRSVKNTIHVPTRCYPPIINCANITNLQSQRLRSHLEELWILSSSWPGSSWCRYSKCYTIHKSLGASSYRSGF